MFRHLMICSIAALLLCSAVAVTVHSEYSDAGEVLTVARQGTGRPCGSCPRQCYRMEPNADRDCAPRSACRMGQNCSVVRCRRGDGSRGFRCRGPVRRPAPPPVVAPPPLSVVTVPPPVVVPPVVPPVVVPPAVVVLPSATSTATASPSVTPSASPSVTPAASVSPTPTATSSVTPTPSVTPSISPSCSFALTGTVGATATNGVCTCGTSTASVTVLAAVNNAGGALRPGTTQDNNVLTCYNTCLTTQIDSKCVPSIFPFFSSQATVTVSNCCESCRLRANVDDPVGGPVEFSPGTGAATAVNQCRLIGV